MTATTLHLLHTQPDTRLLATWIARHHARHQHQAVDLGDALHGLLHAAFGEAAPQPFRYIDKQHGLLAYTPLDAATLRAQVALADPLIAQTLGLSANSQHNGYQLRPFPTHWPAGKTLGFEVRVRPTVRTTIKGEQKRCERDVFQQAWNLFKQARAALPQALEQASTAIPQREQVYAQWLREQLAGHKNAPRQPWQGAVELLNVQLAGFLRSDVVRRKQPQSDGNPRPKETINGPDALLKGHLRVLDGDAFAHLLARGVGRHRAFGFGMLLLRRAN